MSDGSGQPAPPRGTSVPCPGCGASLAFDVARQRLACAHCGHAEDLAAGPPPTKRDLQRALSQQQKAKKAKTRKASSSSSPAAQTELPCRGCGAVVVFAGTLTSTSCAWCETPLVLKDAHVAKDAVAVDALCTFVVDRALAKKNLAAWTRSRWFAPSDFGADASIAGGIDGVYVPFFLFDAVTVTRYAGERGDAYVVEKPTIATQAPQKERKVRWSKRAGAFERVFRDVVVPAFHDLPAPLLRGLEPWPTHRLRPFDEAALLGFLSHKANVALDDGFDDADARIRADLDRDVKQRIGGDEQRVHLQETRMGGLRFQHVLFPLWLYARRYRGAAYLVVVNAVTGAVYGQRPWSAPKIAALVAALLTLLVLFFKFRHDG